jgi:hypothetical protein
MSHAYQQRAREYWESGRPLQAGKMIYENLPKEFRPHWAGNVLDVGRRRFPQVREVDEVYFISCAAPHWERARQAFEAVRALTLANPAAFPGAALLFRLAENTAKVIYNASGGPASYDHNAGWKLVEDLHAMCEFLNDPEFTVEAAKAVLNEQADDY